MKNSWTEILYGWRTLQLALWLFLKIYARKFASKRWGRLLAVSRLRFYEVHVRQSVKWTYGVINWNSLYSFLLQKLQHLTLNRRFRWIFSFWVVPLMSFLVNTPTLRLLSFPFISMLPILILPASMSLIVSKYFYATEKLDVKVITE